MDRATVETEILRRTRRLSAVVGFDVTTVDGTNADLASAISNTILLMGGTVADVTDPTDAEVEAASTAQAEFLIRCELRQLDNIIGNWGDPNEQGGINKQEWGKLLDSVIKRRDGLAEEIDDDFGPADAAIDSITGGVIDYDFQQRFDDTFGFN